MKLIKKAQAKELKIDNVTTAYEYDAGDKDINCAVVILKGRSPKTGYVANKVCKELVHVVKGGGLININNEEYQLSEGDEIIIEPGEKYFWDANMTILVPCAPGWYHEQQEHTEA